MRFKDLDIYDVKITMTILVTTNHNVIGHNDGTKKEESLNLFTCDVDLYGSSGRMVNG